MHGLPLGGVITGATIFAFVTLLLNLSLVSPRALPGSLIAVSPRALRRTFNSRQRFTQMTTTTDYFTAIYTVVTGKPLLLRQWRHFSFSESFFGMRGGRFRVWDQRRCMKLQMRFGSKLRGLSHVDLPPSSGDYDI